MSDKIKALKARIQSLENDDLHFCQFLENITVQDKDAINGRDSFLANNRNNEEIVQSTKEIYLHIVSRMMPYLEAFEDYDQERADEKVDPTNIPCERVFGLLKYAEKYLPNLQFGLLAHHTMAKFNGVAASLSAFDPSKLEEYHRQIPEIEAKIRQEHLDQQANMVDAARRMRDEVL